MSTTREKALNRARVARYRQRKKERRERILSMMQEFSQHVRREKINTDEGQFGGYSYRVFLPQAFYERFEVFRQENGLTGEKFWDEVMVICAERSRIEDMS